MSNLGMMNLDEAKSRLLDHPHGGLLVFHYDVGGFDGVLFLYLFGSNLAVVYSDSKVVEREFVDGGLIEFLNSSRFWLLDNFSYDEVFDDDEYLIAFKDRKGDGKVLHLLNPAYSESMDIQKLISLIESEVFEKLP